MSLALCSPRKKNSTINNLKSHSYFYSKNGKLTSMVSKVSSNFFYICKGEIKSNNNDKNGNNQITMKFVDIQVYNHCNS